MEVEGNGAKRNREPDSHSAKRSAGDITSTFGLRPLPWLPTAIRKLLNLLERRSAVQHFEYHGVDFKSDKAKMAAHPRLRGGGLYGAHTAACGYPETGGMVG